MSMRSFRERFQRSFRRGGSSTTSRSTGTGSSKRRSSIMDLLYLLRRGSSTSSRSPTQSQSKEEKESRKGEQEAFVAEGDIEDDRQLTRDKLLAKIREKRAVIEKLRCQPWPMRRKRRTLILAQKYLQRHESKVSKTHLLKEELSKKWKKFKRWLANVSIYLIPWEAKIKTIESHFGSVVSSYFTFLRWIFWVNVIMTLLMVSFIVIPECLADTFADEGRLRDNGTQRRKHIDPDEVDTADHFHTVWDYKGYLTKSPLFYGYYSNRTYILKNFRYQLPLAYFLVNLFTLGYSFFAILRRMAANTRMSKLTSGKTEQYTFAWKMFAGWDFTIGNSETASNTYMANANKLREAIMEFKTKLKEQFAWITFLMRVLANILILGMIAGSTYAVYHVVENSNKIDNPSAFEQNQVAIVVSFITLVFPNFFELISKSLERFHPRTALRVHLGRILALYLLNFYTLIIALITNIRDEGGESTSVTSAPAELKQAAALTAYNHSNSHFRYGRSIAPDTSLSPTLQPFLHLSTFLLNNITSTLASSLPAATTPIPIFIHLLKGRRPSAAPVSPIIDRFIRQTGRTKGAYYRYRTDKKKSRRTSTSAPSTLTPVTGPFSWTTVHPEAGTVGVKDADAYLLDNITEWMRNNTNELETFPALRPSTPTGGKTSKTSAPFRGEEEHQDALEPAAGPMESHGRRMKAALSARDKRLQCWETWVGQEIAKLITMDLVMTIASVLIVDFFRGLWVRYCNRWWCWNLETVFPEYGEFKVAENVLHIINNQGMIWLGLFFSPLLPAMNNVKLIIIMYVRGWACMTCNIPATQVFRASRSSNFYLLLLLLMLFLCTLPVGYVVAKYTPSAICGPFSHQTRFYHVITDRLERGVPGYIYDQLENLASPGIVIPILVLLALIIYFLVSLIRGLREANQDLQKQLVHERTEEKRKIYQLAGGGKSQKGPSGQSSNGLPESKKVDLSYLPSKEKIRREGWRLKPSLSDDESPVRPSDTDLSTQSPSSVDTTTPASPSKSGYPDFPAPPFPSAAASHSGYFVPSLKSLPEEGAVPVSEVDDGEDDDRQKLLERSKSDTLVKSQPMLAGTSGISKSTMDTVGPDKKRENRWIPSFSNLPAIMEPSVTRFNLRGRQSPQHPTASTPLLDPMRSRSPSPPSLPSHMTEGPLGLAPVVPKFPTSADASLSLTQSITPVSGSYSPTTYDNNYSTPSPSSPQPAQFGDLTARQVADMLSPTKFSPTSFKLFMKAPEKKTLAKSPIDAVTPVTIIQSSRLVQADVLVHAFDTDNERYPSDSGRATMTDPSGTGSTRDAPAYHRRPPGVSGTETDTGTESDMEKFARSRLGGRSPVDDEEERNRKHGRMGGPEKETKLFPRPMSSNFVPWPAPDPSSPKSILKHSGPPGGRQSVSPDATSPTGPSTEPSPFPRRRFTLSVSPSPGRYPDSPPTTDTDAGSSPMGRKRYIIRQTPSPSPKLPRAKMDTAPLLTKLSVVSEVTLLPRLAKSNLSPLPVMSPMGIPHSATDQPLLDEEDTRRRWAESMDNNNKPQAPERRSRAEYPSRSQMVESLSSGATPLSTTGLQGEHSRSQRRKNGGNGDRDGDGSRSRKSQSKETVI